MQWLNLEDNINLLSLIGAVLIVAITVFVVARMVKQMKVKTIKTELLDHSWDGIGEQANNPPLGYLVIFLLTILWVIWYFLWGYPLNSYSRIGEYNAEVKAHEIKFEEKFKNLSPEDKIAMGQNIFLVQCSMCHGITADGINGKAANLNIWGSEEGLIKIITDGSKGMDYPLGEMLGAADLGLSEDDVLAIAAYVSKEVSALKMTKNEHLVAQGKELFATCAGCHGEDGTGMIDGDVVAPNLTAYGSANFVVEVLNRGKNGFIGSMPKFDTNILNTIQKEAVSEYISSLSKDTQ